MTSKAIRSRISELLTKQQEIALKGFDATNRSAFDKMQREVDTLEADYNRVSAMESRDRELNSFERSPRPGISAGQIEERRDQINRAFREYARTGKLEARDLLTTSDATGGALIPQDFYPELTNAAKYYGPIALKVKQKVTNNNGAPMKVSLANDTANGLTLVATEGTSSPAETDPSFQSKLLGVDTVTGGLVKISFEEMADSSFNLDTAIRDYFGIRYGRGMEAAVTLGKDSAGTTLPNQSSGGLLGAATVGTTTATLAGGIAWTDIVNLFGSLDPAYSGPNAAFVFNSNTRAYLLGQKDGFGRPYWTPDPTQDSPFGKLLGFDVVLNQAMPNMGASATPILFGDLQRAYLLRTDGAPSILRLNERYADTLEVGFFLYSRIGGLSLNAGVSPLVSLEQAAS